MRDRSHVVMFSGGAASYAAAKYVAAKHGTERLWLFFTDTSMEDQDLYRFLHEAAADVGGTLEIYKDGRTPWEVFRETRFLGNTRVDPCSRILKREPARRWIRDTFKPDDVELYVGITWEEQHRLDRMKKAWSPYRVHAPLVEEELMKDQVLQMVIDAGLELPRLYDLGFAHNNCGGFCIKSGMGQFANLLKTMPTRYAWHEAQEEQIRTLLDQDVSILRDRSGGQVRPLTLAAFRERVAAADQQLDLFDWGGCGCFSGEGP